MQSYVNAAATKFRNALLRYTGDDAPTSKTTSLYYVNDAGTVVEVISELESGGAHNRDVITGTSYTATKWGTILLVDGLGGTTTTISLPKVSDGMGRQIVIRNIGGSTILLQTAAGSTDTIIGNVRFGFGRSIIVEAVDSGVMTTIADMVDILPNAADVLPWTASETVGYKAFRKVTVLGATHIMWSQGPRTTGATLDVAELANWTHWGQDKIPEFAGNTLIPYGFRVYASDGVRYRSYQNTTNHVTAATFSAAEQALWTADSIGSPASGTSALTVIGLGRDWQATTQDRKSVV